ncbi:hypothetical protein [Sphingomonas bacterium]|uniref:hypothetical protein n=1 Tax=Sphingomonas bacterium TaxID=1895847 RepID=UPI00260832CE|nr:hypothetical protein [Sphingomonas bacterium]MDB5678109.1 hypothetical protein [Sphingomonas bacterium]
MPVTPDRSEAQGAVAGVIAVVASVPMLGIALVIALVLQRTVVAKVLHQDVEFSDMQSGSTGILANIVLSVLVGWFAAFLAGLVALKLVKAAAVRGFVIVSGVGFVAIALGIFRWLAPRAHGHTFSLGLLVAFGWIAAMLGAYIAAMVRDEPDLAP